MNEHITIWGNKPYNSFDYYCKKTFHEKLYKIALDAGFTCPNRDGTLDKRGCIFCSAGGSGDFAIKTANKSISEQLKEGIALFHDKKIGTHFIAYFQAYTNTYGAYQYLRETYTQALNDDMIYGISIATRPDCLSAEVLTLLQELQLEYPGKFIWVELGLQTIHENTAQFIRRGYSLDVFDKAVLNLKKINIPVIVHIIIGLPNETKEMLLETIDYVNHFHIFGIKLQLLHVLRGTDLADIYQDNHFSALALDEYLDLLILCIQNLSPDTVLHRITGDGPKDLLIAPLWSLNKRNVLNTFHKKMKQNGAYQGQYY